MSAWSWNPLSFFRSSAVVDLAVIPPAPVEVLAEPATAPIAATTMPDSTSVIPTPPDLKLESLPNTATATATATEVIQSPGLYVAVPIPQRFRHLLPKGEISLEQVGAVARMCDALTNLPERIPRIQSLDQTIVVEIREWVNLPEFRSLMLYAPGYIVGLTTSGEFVDGRISDYPNTAKALGDAMVSTYHFDEAERLLVSQEEVVLLSSKGLW